MATNKTGKKKRTKLKKKTAATKRKRVKKPVAKNQAKKPASKKKAVSKKAAAKTKARPKKQTAATLAARKKGVQLRGQISDVEQFPRPERSSRSAGQSGDLEGLSDVERADSESVDELLEEGNSFEADVVAGVQSADDADESEVHTHEVPDDDVPEEYLEKE